MSGYASKWDVLEFLRLLTDDLSIAHLVPLEVQIAVSISQLFLDTSPIIDLFLYKGWCKGQWKSSS